jgi:hypothetical protein
MALTISADFVPLPAQNSVSAPAFHQAPRAGHVRVDVSRAMSQPGAPYSRPQPNLVEQGQYECPCEIDLELSTVLGLLAAQGSYAFDFFVEPLEPRALRLDVDLHRSRDGETWSSETVVHNCRPGTSRVSNVSEVFGETLRLRMRCVGDSENALVPVRVWLRNPGRG